MYAPDLTSQLPGPAWLRNERAESAAVAASTPLPSAEAEEWRYSPIGAFVADAFAPATTPPSGDASPAPIVAGLAAAAAVVTVDGFLADLVRRDDRIEVGSVGARDAAVDLRVDADVFTTSNAAFAPDPLLVRVPAGIDVDGPIVITHRVDSADAAVFPRLAVEVGANASVTVVEVLVSRDVSALIVPVTTIAVGDAARVTYQQIQQLGVGVWQLATLDVDVASQASFAGGVAALGGSYARLRTDCRLSGRGASGDLSAVYYGAGEQVLDFRTFQRHIGRDTTSNLLFKGVVDDASTSIYTGLIKVGVDAAGSNAFQTNRTIKLSERAWAESVPNLEIENNDVRCSHASTVAPVDEQQRFYLESRGVPSGAAERLIVQGFLRDVVASLPVAEVEAGIASAIDAELDRRAR